MIIELKRVNYSKKGIKAEDREYQRTDAGIFSSVGKLSEWQKAFPDAEFKIKGNEDNEKG
jgi:hypothetical protein